MKITAIETLVCHARMRNWVFVKVETDQPGLIGWGEATLEWHTRSIVGAIEDMSHLLIGEDPTREGLLETPDRVLRAFGEHFAGYQQEFLQLFGFGFQGVDYDADVDPAAPIPGLVA